MSKFKRFVSPFFWFVTGLVIGGFLFSKSQPRSFMAIKNCDNCTSPADMAGIIASVGMQRFLPLIPGKVLETDKTLVIRHPMGRKRIHYVLIPKKDIKNASDISEQDEPYLVDIYRVARKLIQDEGLIDYRFYTNGQGHQTVSYLHFHLISD